MTEYLTVDRPIHLAAAGPKNKHPQGVAIVQGTDGQYMAATDGTILAVIPAAGDLASCVGRVIPADAIGLVKPTTKNRKPVQLDTNTVSVTSPTTGAKTEYEYLDEVFPRVDLVVKGSSREFADGRTVTVDAALLARLAKALGSDELTLFLPADNKKAIVVLPHRMTGFGLLMPCTPEKGAAETAASRLNAFTAI